MKYLKTYEEKVEADELFKNPEWLKTKLLMDKDFALGDVQQALMNIAYEHLQKTPDMSQDQFHVWIEQNMGKIPLLAVKFGNYNYQVCNGGHAQYFDNGYASRGGRGFSFGSSYDNIENHEELVRLFDDLNMTKNMPLGKNVYEILTDFNLELDEEEDCEYCDGSGQESCSTCEGNGYITCDECQGEGQIEEDEECPNCDGNGTIECGDCDGKGNIKCDYCNGDGYTESGNPHVSHNTSQEWSKLDDRWYDINDDVSEQFNDYLKSLSVGAEPITDLIPFAERAQKFNL